jgi:hypothetical protein
MRRHHPVREGLGWHMIGKWSNATRKWLQHLSDGAPQFIGSLTGSLLELLTLLLGTFYNARLNRKRDDRLGREEDARAVAVGLRTLIEHEKLLSIAENWK